MQPDDDIRRPGYYMLEMACRAAREPAPVDVLNGPKDDEETRRRRVRDAAAGFRRNGPPSFNL